jgi:hypothetical protein
VKGVQFLTDEQGEKTAVLIDLKRYGDIWEDLHDSIVAKQRAEEPRESFELVKERIRQNAGRKKL